MDFNFVQVISKEIIKPSSQTPQHLKNHKLSVLDQIAPPVYFPFIFFYQAKELNSTSKISQKLKQSLSNTLTAFYPLAGRLDQEKFAVDCNDAGVKYVEARVHARLLDFIQDPKTEQLKQLLPVSTGDFAENFFLAVQINYFDCGGIAIVICLWHQIADGVSSMAFVNAWSATCRGTYQVQVLPSPRFDLAEHFPDLHGNNMSKSSGVMSLVSKRLVFDKEKIKTLREAASSTESANAVQNPTRTELVSAFIWKCFTQAVKKSEDLYSSFAATQAVNLRQRTAPGPHSLEHVFGNCFVDQLVILGNDVVIELHDLVRGFRKAIRVVDDEYIQKTQRHDEDGYLSVLSKAFSEFSRGGVDYCGFSSWCGFRVYEVDYGWGKPVWFGTMPLSLLNFTVLMNTRDGDGIEAWINAVPENIQALESHFKLLSDANVDSIANP